MPVPDLESFKVANGEGSSATKFNNLVQAIEDEFADIDADQIAGYTADANKLLHGGGGWAGPVTIANTVAGLGTASGGALGALRIGSSPYDLISLIYDATIAKWVSPAHHLPTSVNNVTTTSATYAEFGGGTLFIYSGMPNFKRIYDAGLRPQVRIYVVAFASAGTPNARIGLGIDEYTSGDTTIVELGTTEGSAFDSGDFALSTSAKFLATDWLSATMNAPSEPHVQFSAQGRIASGTLTVSTLGYEFRWVSA